MKFCQLCKHWDGKQCGHENRAFIQKSEYGCQFFQPKDEKARVEVIRILRERESKLNEEVAVIEKWTRAQLEKAGVIPERIARAITAYWRLSHVAPRKHPRREIAEARRLIRRAKSPVIRAYLSRIISEDKRAKALECIEMARLHPKLMYWQETARQSLVKQVTKFLSGDLKLTWLVLTSNKENLEAILKTGRQQIYEKRQPPRIPPHIKRYMNKLMMRDLEISEIPKSILDELTDRGLAVISEEEGIVRPSEYLQLLFFDKKI